MKKTFIITVAFSALSFVSCKKDYVCSCVIKYSETAESISWGNAVPEDSSVKYSIKDKKKSAETKCSAYEGSGTDFWTETHYETTCSLD